VDEAAMTREVGTVTVMFTDLADSTAMRGRLGEEAADAVRGLHDALLTDAIRAHGGRVVKHLGDGLMAAFPSAAGAVGAAVALQQEIDRANRRGAPEAMRVRVGLSTGDVTFEDDDCFGLPVVEAQRLEASAEPGTIRCAEIVKLLARGRGGHEYVALGELPLKGLVEPLAACEVRWVPLDDDVDVSTLTGLPPVFAHAGGLPFCGRDVVFEQLVDAWKRCAAGGFETVLLAGEPGIGKTRLAQELASRVHGGSGLVLAGRCDEEVAVPFQAFGAALDWLMKQTAPPDRLAVLGEYGGELVRLLPDLADRVSGLPARLRDDPDTERYRLFQATASWLSCGGGERPRLLVIDDLHWADKPTLLLLRHLITNPVAGLMVLCTYRDTDVDRSHPLASMLADFRRTPAVTRIAVGGLADDGVRDLLVRMGGHELDAAGLAFAELVHRETSGNPFFVGEVLRHLTETGALVERDGRWTSSLRPEEAGIPEGIREVVGRRLSRLGDDADEVLRAAAVIGYEFDIGVLADVVGRDVDGLLDVLDNASRASLVIEVDVNRHRFAHALVRETLHGELSASRRARQHRRVAEVLETRHAGNLDAVVTDLATHWAEASAGGDPRRAIEMALRAGAQTNERGAWENTIRWYQSAGELMADEPAFATERRHTLVALAEAQANSGAIADARRSVAEAASMAVIAGDVDTACAALSVHTRASFDGSTDLADLDKVALIRAALALPSLDDARRADLLSQLSTELIFVGDSAGRRTAFAELWAILPSLDATDHARILLNSALGYGAQARDRLEAMDVLFDGALSAARPDQRRVLVLNRFWNQFFLGRRGVLDASLSELEQLEAKTPTRAQWVPLLGRTTCCAIDGDLSAADQASQEMLRLLEAWAVPEAQNFQTTTTIMIGRERRNLGRLVSLAEVGEQMGSPVIPARCLAAFIHFATGDSDRALTALEKVHVEEFPDDVGYHLLAALWGEIAAAVGSDDQRRAFAAILAPLSTLHLGTGGLYLGAADRLRALLLDRLGEHEVADGLFAAAVQQHQDFRSPTWVARTQLDWAESLLGRTRPDDARLHLDAAAAALGNLDLPDNRLRLGELRARLADG
jgi:class 3 adenylate cyclase/tetratricopeptide (TPR) repeat protein